METNTSATSDEYGDSLAFFNVASKRHINLDDIENLTYIIYESEYGKKMRKVNRNRKKLKIQNTSQTIANSER
jgi:hypothetical protein